MMSLLTVFITSMSTETRTTHYQRQEVRFSFQVLSFTHSDGHMALPLILLGVLLYTAGKIEITFYPQNMLYIYMYV